MATYHIAILLHAVCCFTIEIMREIFREMFDNMWVEVPRFPEKLLIAMDSLHTALKVRGMEMDAETSLGVVVFDVTHTQKLTGNNGTIPPHCSLTFRPLGTRPCQ